MTVTKEEQDARNRWSQVHRARRDEEKTVGWRGRASVRAAEKRQEARLDAIEGDPLCAAPNQSSDLVVVCIQEEFPEADDGGHYEDVDASIRSVLAGTHENVQVVLISDEGDGLTPSVWDELSDGVLEDPRVVHVVFDGAPSAPNVRFAAVARLTSAPYIAFQGCRDLSEPTRLADQLAAIINTGADACFTGATERPAGGVTHAGTVAQPNLDGEVAPPGALFRVDAIRRLGGIHPEAGGIRMLTSAVALLGRVVTTRKPLYVRRGPEMLDRASEPVSELWTRAFVGAATSVATAVQALKSGLLRARDRTEPDEPWAPMHEIPRPVPTAKFVEMVLRSVFDDPDARREALAFLAELVELEPHRVLLASAPPEVAVVAAMYGGATGTRPVVLERTAELAADTRKALAKIGIEAHADVRYAEVKEFLVEPVGYVWHVVDAGALAKGGPLDYVYAAGPVGESRHGAMFALRDALRVGSRLHVAQDAEREKTVDIWAAHQHLAVRDIGEHGMIAQLIEDPDSAAKVAVTILTGSRPKLLHRTLKSLAEHDPRLVEEGTVLLLVNGADEDSVKVVEKFSWVDRVETTDEILPVGPAVTQLLGMVPDECEFVLHLEDDWECQAEGWRARALAILRMDNAVGQVVLGSSEVGEPTLNPISGRRIKWERKRSPRGFRYRLAEAAWSFHPAFVRRDTALALLPVQAELDAMQTFHALGPFNIARFFDSPFRHIGGDDSLRAKLGR